MEFFQSDWFYSIAMAVVQGLSEFLPISSSGHLSLLNIAFGVSGDAGIDFTFFLHIATLFAALIYFRKDIARIIVSWLPKNAESMAAERRITIFLIISMLVTGPIGFLFKDLLVGFSESLLVIGLGFLLTAVVLYATEQWLAKSAKRVTQASLGWKGAAFIGFFQGIAAIIPGFSRSGSTIASGMMAGLSREEATRYSFLLTIPVIIAGALLDLVNWFQGELQLPAIQYSIVGFLVAGIVGYIAIAFMIQMVKKYSLKYFAVYCGLLGVACIALFFI